MIAQFIGECIVPVYGIGRIKDYCKTHKGSCFLCYLNMSCLAYGITLLLDKHERWEAQVVLEESLETAEEKALLKRYRRSSKGMEASDIERFRVNVKNKFTLKKGRVVGYGNHGCSNKGLRYYKTMKKFLEEMDKNRCCGVMTCWDEWTEENGFDYEYNFCANKIQMITKKSTKDDASKE